MSANPKKRTFVTGLLWGMIIVVLFAACSLEDELMKELQKKAEDALNTHVTSVSLDHTSIVMGVGETFTLSATITPADATNKQKSWSSSDESVAAISWDDNCIVTAISVGTAAITVTTVDGNFKASCDVTVSNAVLTRIEITAAPVKTIYAIGEDLDITGLEVSAVYDDGSNRPIPLVDLDDVSGFDSDIKGIKTVTVTYSGKSTSFTVTVINITGPYTVTFNSNGGSDVEPQTVPRDGTAFRPVNPTRDFHGFVDWYTDGSLAEPAYDFTTPVTEDIELFGKWSDIYYTVTYQWNYDGSPAYFHMENVGPGGKISKPAKDPVREGCVFDGWYKEAECYNLWGFGINSITSNTPIYAKWIGLLDFDVSTGSIAITTLVDGAYNETTRKFTVYVKGFLSDSAAANVVFNVNSTDPKLQITGYDKIGNASGGVKSFEMTVTYNGTISSSSDAVFTFYSITGFPQSDHRYEGGVKTVSVAIRDGLAEGLNSAIPVTQANNGYFNKYANTSAGLSRHYILNENVTLTPPAPGVSNWTAIGNSLNPFTGSFNGNNYTITNIIINEADTPYHGIFGYINGGKVKNLALENCDVCVIGDSSNIGGIVGRLWGGTVENCSVNGTVTGYSQIGGIVGFVFSGAISNCYSEGAITAVESDAGGIAGCNDGAIRNCYSTGTITTNDCRAGGIAGFSDGTISNCYSTGNVYVAYDAGGIAGYVGIGTISNCYSTGNVSAVVERAGGIAGYVGGTIRNCYSTGNITAVTERAGGIVGYLNRGSISYCAAINPSITTPKEAGRIIGLYSGMILATNNFALDTMLDPGAGKFSAGGQNDNGASKTATMFRTKETYSGSVAPGGLGGLGWNFGSDDNNPWVYIDGEYPVLFWE